MEPLAISYALDPALNKAVPICLAYEWYYNISYNSYYII